MYPYRKAQKQAAIVARIRKYRSATCDLCQSRAGTELHEIIARGRTIHDEAVRQMTYSQYICPLLCHECHQNGHITSETALNTLFNRLFDIYGYEAVETAFLTIPNQFRYTIKLPEKEMVYLKELENGSQYRLNTKKIFTFGVDMNFVTAQEGCIFKYVNSSAVGFFFAIVGGNFSFDIPCDVENPVVFITAEDFQNLERMEN